MVFCFEMTDTFGGEANYSWVRRCSLSLPDSTTDLSLVRKAKRWAGWAGMRATTTKFGDTIEIRPACMSQVLFITWLEDEPRVEDVANPEDNPYIYHPRSTRTAFVAPRSLKKAMLRLVLERKLGSDALSCMSPESIVFATTKLVAD